MKKIKNLKKKNGFSLIELLLVLGIIAALAITAFMIYPKVSASNNAQTEATNINTIKASVTSLYSSSPDYTGLDTEVGIKSKIFPDTMINTAGTAAVNTFKGQVTLGTSKESPSNATDSSFTITYEDVPSAECVKLVSAVASNFYKITVGGATVKAASTGTGAASGLNVTQLSTSCATGDTEIVFTSL